MFSYKRTIRLRETDATGVLYFSEQLNLAQEAFEAYFLSSDLTILKMIEEKEFLMPIVHAEAQFSLPMHVGDSVVVDLSVAKMGSSSFTLVTRIHRDSMELGTTKIVHVVVDAKSGKSMPLPKRLIGHLQAL